MAKRLFDLSISTLALAVLALPMVIIALWVRWDSPGPALYRQVRVGHHGLPFRILKFRTMHRNADRVGLSITVGQDPRITRAGRWLRRTRVDEIPQLINVLLGQMSLVGPRPEVPAYLVHYPPEVREVVLSVRPGITDPAALAFRHEARELSLVDDPQRHYIEHVLPAKLRFQADYIGKATLLSDLRVLVATLGVLRGR